MGYAVLTIIVSQCHTIHFGKLNNKDRKQCLATREVSKPLRELNSNNLLGL